MRTECRQASISTCWLAKNRFLIGVLPEGVPDFIRLGAVHIVENRIVLRTRKTDAQIEVPIHPVIRVISERCTEKYDLVPIHAVGRSFATNFLKAGDVPLAAISKVLGHSEIATTVRYLGAGLQHMRLCLQRGSFCTGDNGRRRQRIGNTGRSTNKKELIVSSFFWCPGQDSNLHEPNCSLPPQSSVSTNFTTWARSPYSVFGCANIGDIFQSAKFSAFL